MMRFSFFAIAVDLRRQKDEFRRPRPIIGHDSVWVSTRRPVEFATVFTLKDFCQPEPFGPGSRRLTACRK